MGEVATLTLLKGYKDSLCIGLGGTGREILMQIRRLIIESYGSLQGLPIVGFLHIDTDGNTQRSTGSSTGDNYQGQRIAFDPCEQVHTAVSETTVRELRENARLPIDDGNPDKVVLEWFPKSLIQNTSAIRDGAGAVRPVGRLALFKNINNIERSLRDISQKVLATDSTQLIRERGLQVSQGLNIFVVGSLCGGTGSGMFIDIGYIIRKLFLYQGVEPDVHGYFVISPRLYGDNQTVRANAYAALVELDYYSKIGTVFKCQYDPDQSPIEEAENPYEFVYLLSDSTAKSKFVLPADTGRDQLFHLMAQKISLFFTSPDTARASVSSRDNLRKVIERAYYDKHPRPNFQRYMTMGLSRIYFPKEKLSVKVTLDCKKKIIDFWRNGTGQHPKPEVLLEEFYKDLKLNTDNDIIKSELMLIPVHGNLGFDKNQSQWRKNQENTVESSDSSEVRDLCARLSIDISQRLEKIDRGGTEQETGVLVNALIRGTERVKEKLKSKIDSFLVNLLKPSNEYFSLAIANSWLIALREDIGKRRLTYNKNAITGNFKINTVEILAKSIASIESSIWPFGKGRKIKNGCLRPIAEADKEVRAKYEDELFKQADEIAKYLMDSIQNILDNLVKADNILKYLDREYLERKEVLAVSPSREIGYALDGEKNVKKVSEEIIPTDDLSRRQQLSLISQKVLERLNATNFTFLLEKKGQDKDLIRESLDDILDGQVASVANEKLGSAIQQFMDLDTPNKLEAIIQDLLDKAAPLLPLNQDDGRYDNSDDKLTKHVAFHDPGDDPSVDSFRKILEKAGFASTSTKLPGGEKHQVIFMSEYCGFPLRLINDLLSQDMRSSYKRLTEKDRTRMHIDKRIEYYSDIIPPDVILLEKVKPLFFKSLALEINFIENKDEEVQIVFQNDYGETIRKTLSKDWGICLDIITSIPKVEELMAHLEGNLNRKIANLTLEEWDTKYRGLIYNRMIKMKSWSQDKDINYPYVKEVVGGGDDDAFQQRPSSILGHLYNNLDMRFRQNIPTGQSPHLPGSSD